MIEAIEKLLKSDLTSYKIGKDTGISVQQIDHYRKSMKIGNITLANALKLYDYYKKINKKNF